MPTANNYSRNHAHAITIKHPEDDDAEGKQYGGEFSSGPDTLPECLNRVLFIIQHIQQRIELRNLQQCFHLQSGLQELQFRAVIARRGKRARQLPRTRTVYKSYAGEIEKDLFLPILNQFVNLFPKHYAALWPERVGGAQAQ